jgi:hypothetical protein
MSQTWIPQHKLIAPHISSAAAVDRSERISSKLQPLFLWRQTPCTLWIAGCVGSTTEVDMLLKENSHFIKN